MKNIMRWLLVSAFLVSSAAWSQLTIQITQGRDKPTSIAVVPLGWNGAPLPEDIAGIVAADLKRSG